MIPSFDTKPPFEMRVSRIYSIGFFSARFKNLFGKLRTLIIDRASYCLSFMYKVFSEKDENLVIVSASTFGKCMLSQSALY